MRTDTVGFMATANRGERTVHIRTGDQDALAVVARHDAVALDELVDTANGMLPGVAEMVRRVGGVQPGTHADTGKSSS